MVNFFLTENISHDRNPFNKSSPIEADACQAQFRQFKDNSPALQRRADIEDMMMIYQPANTDRPINMVFSRNQKIIEWLSRLAQPGLSFETLGEAPNRHEKTSVEQTSGTPLFDDWQTVAHICGHSFQDFTSAGANLPLTAAEVDHFRRNHRGTESHVSRDFLTARADLPSPLGELYGLYQHRIRVDAEATLFVAQATGSTRLARVMADMLAIGGFANGLEYIGHMGTTYSVPAAFDSSDIIDRANHEAARRLALSVDHPSHLLKLTHDEIGVLASNIVEKHALAPMDFMEKANMLAEARQDVTRLPVRQHFVTAIAERDLPVQQVWVLRIVAAYSRIMEGWISNEPEIQTLLQ